MTMGFGFPFLLLTVAGLLAVDVCWAAAWAAAVAAEREWQTTRLLDYAHGRLS